MRIRTKLILLLLLLSAMFAAGRCFYQLLEDKRMYALFRENTEEKNIYFDKLIKLKGANLETLAFDYTYWDEMVAFILNNDIEWAKKMMDETVLKTYQTDAIWIYKKDLSPIYSVNRQDVADIREFPLPRTMVSNIFLKERFCHFFVNTGAGLMEIRGATIHPTSDPMRKTSPQGHFFAGRLWDTNYIDELARLVGGEIKISPTKQAVPNFQNLSKNHTIIFSRELADWEGKPAAYINVRIQSKELESYKLFSRNVTIIFIVFLISVVIFIAVFFTVSLNMPFAMISRALRTENLKSLRGLETDRSEFGDISRLISKFFEQREDLFKEITERKKVEEKLSQALEESVKSREIMKSMLDDNNEIKDELEKSLKRLKDAQAQLIHAEKMEAVGRMAGGVAHEVKNPLAIILLAINYLEGVFPPGDKDNREMLQIMKDSVKRADSIVRALLDFSRIGELKMEQQGVNTIIESSLGLIQHRLRLNAVESVCELEKDLPKVLMDIGKIEQVFVNLFNNAIDAMPKGGKLYVHSYLSELKVPVKKVGNNEGDIFRLGEEAIIVEIEDTGAGIDEGIINKIFDPFFTTKNRAEGTGLGLSVAKSIIEMHKGLINVESEKGKGTKFTIIFKLSGEA